MRRLSHSARPRKNTSTKRVSFTWPHQPYEYHRDFAIESINRIELAIMEAEEEMDPVDGALQVYGVFTLEACRYAQDGSWSVQDVKKEVAKFWDWLDSSSRSDYDNLRKLYDLIDGSQEQTNYRKRLRSITSPLAKNDKPKPQLVALNIVPSSGTVQEKPNSQKPPAPEAPLLHEIVGAPSAAPPRQKFPAGDERWLAGKVALNQWDGASYLGLSDQWVRKLTKKKQLERHGPQAITTKSLRYYWLYKKRGTKRH